MEEAMVKIEKALSLAIRAHENQVDKAQVPYILHPLRVAMKFTGSLDPGKGFQGVPFIVAILHDVVEDTRGLVGLNKQVTIDDIKAEFGVIVAEAVDKLTRREGEEYFEYIERCATDPLAKLVKKADLEDNLNPKRIANISESQVNRYIRALEMLNLD
jgi:(p)ppGpp synthase/HD superfamily hydrolase